LIAFTPIEPSEQLQPRLGQRLEDNVVETLAQAIGDMLRDVCH
jgi:hypothetical protein